MTDTPDQAAPPSDQPEGQTAGAPQDREISPDKLQEILKQHQKWVETGEKEGKQANLQDANLQDANLQKANPEGEQSSPSGVLQGPRRKAPHGSPDRIRPYTAVVRQNCCPHGPGGVYSRFLNFRNKLKEILEQRQKWEETGEKEGKQANLQDANPEGGQPSPSGALQGPRRKAPHRSPDRIRPYTAFVTQNWGPHGQAGLDSRLCLNFLRGLVFMPICAYYLFMW